MINKGLRAILLQKDWSTMIYMDNASTTKVDPEAFDIAKKYLLENYANPSSSYSMANDVKADIQDAR